MSNHGYHGGYFVCSGQAPFGHTDASAGAVPTNQRPQAFMSLRHHSFAAASPSRLCEVAPHAPLPVSNNPSPSTATILVRHHDRVPASLSRPYLASSAQMDSYAFSPGGVAVNAADMSVEPRALYPADIHHSQSMPFFPAPVDFSSVDPTFVQQQDHPFPHRLPSPNLAASSQGSHSPSAAGSISEKAVDQPYAKLIFEALKGAPNNSMILKQIYAWFEKNTDKPQRAPKGKQGWKNSIRHNLSMNEAFEKVPPPNPQERDGKGCIWKLSRQALIDDHVLSTTRYRTKSNKHRRQSSSALHQRQGNGGRVLKRPTPQERLVPHPEPLFFQADLNEPRCQDGFASHSPYAPSHYPYPAAQSLDDAFLSEMNQGAALFSPIAADGPGFGQNLSLYEHAATPASTVSTAADSASSQGQSGCQMDEPMLDGVSTHARNYDLFSDHDIVNSQDQHSYLPSECGHGDSLFPDMNPSQVMTMDEFSEWPLNQLDQGDGQEHGHFPIHW